MKKPAVGQVIEGSEEGGRSLKGIWTMERAIGAKGGGVDGTLVRPAFRGQEWKQNGVHKHQTERWRTLGKPFVMSLK